MSTYICSVCNRQRESQYYSDTPVTTNVNNPNYDHVCPYCTRERLTTCAYCQDKVMRQYMGRVSDTEGSLPTGHVCSHCITNYDLVHCLDCGLYKNRVDMTNETSDLCSQCYSDHYTHCRHCGHLMRREGRIIDGHRVFSVCNDCERSVYFSCYVCGSLHERSQVTEVDGHNLCVRCVSNCYHCDECGSLCIDRVICSDGMRRCTTCLNNSFEYCNECHQYVTRPHRHVGIRSYSYKPHPNFIGKTDDGLFYGIELECETSGHRSVRDMSTELLDRFSDSENNFYIKTDGSLHDGLEVVSHPHTLTKLVKSQWLESVCQTLVDNKFKSHDTVTCGLHVHMSKSAFLDGIHETKFSYFLYESQFTRVIARRDFNSYCNKIDKHLSTNRPDNTSRSRYEGVNFTNSETVEVRVFKGTLKHNTLVVCLLYCDAIFKFTQTARISVLSGTQRDSEFLKFIQYKPKYAKLYYYLTTPQTGSQSSNQTTSQAY